MKNIFIKRLQIISFIIVIAICVTTVKNNMQDEVISTMSVPVTNKVIVVDAGHGRRRWRSG